MHDVEKWSNKLQFFKISLAISQHYAGTNGLIGKTLIFERHAAMILSTKKKS